MAKGQHRRAYAVQVRAGVNTRSRGTEWLVSLREARLGDGVQAAAAQELALLVSYRPLAFCKTPRTRYAVFLDILARRLGVLSVREVGRGWSVFGLAHARLVR